MIFSYSNTWNFLHKGMQFPGPAGATSGQIRFIFNSPSSVIVNYGDGSLITYPTGTANRVQLDAGTNSDITASFPKYTYTQGDASTIRQIKIKLPEPEKLISISIDSNMLTMQQSLPVRFAQLTNLGTLALVNLQLTGIDENYLKLNNITFLSLRNAFQQGTRYYGSIPTDMLTGKKYTTLGYASQLGGKSFSQSNLDQIAPNLGSTLVTLALDGNNFTDVNGTDGALPENFSDLKVLTTLNLNSNSFTAPPAVINSITSLISLTISINPLATWGNLGALINLNTLSLASCPLLQPVVPGYFASLTKLKNLHFAGSFGNTTNAEAFISSFYSFVTTNTALTGANTLPFRGMTIVIGNNASDNVSASGHIITGTYQAPTGYVQGSNNGTPGSALEMIYVLETQYGHKWTYRTA
ncbi:hypothetical protein SAMN05421788_101845 [Filimonas lacunae]|uniref:Leucine rich repeat-containing protein n=1 Tax=Filimonas lacunae TaxID=477680 RepID=A0A173MPM5_9BACT|nr:hypothetical protein [Filimonas lacunae]BAV09409.1 leucine-rich repeat containing protein [Filimonas lacunae]SIS72617.1 hypothetical protein SAMN05421788_101845 [Filimonas lacunae]